MTKVPMANTNQRRIFRILIFLLVPISLVGILGFEYVWRTQVGGGQQSRSIVSVIQSNGTVRRVVGNVISVDFARLGSKADFGLFGSEDRGRYRYLVKGTTARMDVVVTWHAKSRTSDPTVDKIESIENGQKETIWMREAGAP